jgi:hypothetical protein
MTFEELRLVGKSEEEIRKIKKAILQGFYDDQSGLVNVARENEEAAKPE